MTEITKAATDVLAERERQKIFEGWTPEHDDRHTDNHLAHAAASYAIWGWPEAFESPPQWWPWERNWWKPTSRRRSLVKAAALLIAEIERLDRAMLAAFPTDGAAVDPAKVRSER